MDYDTKCEFVPPPLAILQLSGPENIFDVSLINLNTV
jgi:hypothetical protein